MTFLKTGSGFDPAAATALGKLAIIDVETDTKVEKTKNNAENAASIQQSIDYEKSLITLEPKPDHKNSAVYRVPSVFF